MSVKYKILFVTELLHDYYADKQSKDFVILPSAETQQVLLGQAMLYKVIGNKLIVLVKVNGPGTDENKPFIALSKTSKFTFYIKVDNPHFFNITNINFQPSANKRYYFSNVQQNKEGSTLHLSHRIAAYNSANIYAVGSFASNAMGETFEAIKSNSNSNQHNLSEASYWKPKGVSQFVSDGDLIELTPALYHFTAVAATDFTIRIFGLNTTTGIYDVQVKDTEIKSFSFPQTKITIKLHDLPAGKYRIQVNAESAEVYVDSDALYKNIFAIIEVFNYLDNANDFALLKPDGTPRENTFSIRFANRSVIWKYRAKTTDITAILDAAYTFTAVAPGQFVSNEPIPLTEKPLSTVNLQSTLFGNLTAIANPIRDRLQLIAKDGETYYCAEKFLNY